MPADRISIVMRGVAAKAGSILTYGHVWGQDAIVRATTLRDTRIVSALTYVEVAFLTTEDLYKVLEDYPKSARLLQISAMKLAMQTVTPDTISRPNPASTVSTAGTVVRRRS